MLAPTQQPPNLLQTEKHSSHRRSKGHGDASSGGRRQNLSLLGLVVVVLGEQSCEHVATATGNVHQRTLFPHCETRSHGQGETYGLHQERLGTKVTADDKATQYCLYLC